MTTAVRSTMFIDSILEKFIPDYGDQSASVQREALRGKLVKVIQVYADDNHAGNVATTMSNLAWGFFSKSDWALAKAALTPLARQAIANHFQVIEKDVDNQKLKADALSEFLMRYLVTQECRQYGKQYRLIPDAEWDGEKMDQVSIEEIIERAIHGNGYHLGKHKIRDLLQLINIEKHHIRHRIKTIHEELRSEADLHPWIAETTKIDDINEIFLNEIRRMIEEYRQSVSSIDRLEVENSQTYKGPDQTLCDNLFELRLMKKVFDNVQQVWNHLISFKPRKGREGDDQVQVYLHLMKFGVFMLKVWSSIIDTMEIEVEDQYLLWPGTRMFLQEPSKPIQKVETKIGQMRAEIENDLQQLEWIGNSSPRYLLDHISVLHKNLISIFQRIRECNRLHQDVQQSIKENEKRRVEQSKPYESLERSVLKRSLDESMYFALARAHAEDR